MRRDVGLGNAKSALLIIIYHCIVNCPKSFLKQYLIISTFSVYSRFRGSLLCTQKSNQWKQTYFLSCVSKNRNVSNGLQCMTSPLFSHHKPRATSLPFTTSTFKWQSAKITWFTLRVCINNVVHEPLEKTRLHLPFTKFYIYLCCKTNVLLNIYTF